MGDVTVEHTITELVERDLSWLPVKGLMASTINIKGRYLTYFLRWCHDRGHLDPGDFSRKTLERYQRFIYEYRTAQEQSLSPTSQRKRIAAVRDLFKWLYRNEYLTTNIAEDMELPRKKSTSVKAVLTIEEVERFLSQPDIHTPYGLRDRAILETLYSTGIRRMELTEIKLNDLDLNRGLLTIPHGKGDKQRNVPIGMRAVSWINNYLLESRPFFLKDLAEPHLFLTLAGSKLSLSYLTQIGLIYKKLAGIDKQGSCHIFRHTAATLMLENGADIRYIQEFLGHSSLLSTQIYTQVSIRKLKEVHSQTHPARLGTGSRKKKIE